MNLANWLTVLRIVLIPFFIATLIYQHLVIALIIFIFAAITDILDGYVARRTTCTPLGRILDPTADKLLLVSTYVILPIINIIPTWLTIIVVSRDVIIALGYLIIYITWASSKIEVSRLGKISTLIQSIGVGFFILSAIIPVLLPYNIILIILIATITSISGIEYIIQGIIRANQLSHQKEV